MKKSVVKKPSELFVLKVLTNPFYAIDIDPDLCVKHEKLTTKAEWIKSFCSLVEKEGVPLEEALFMVLDNLEGHYV